LGRGYIKFVKTISTENQKQLKEYAKNSVKLINCIIDLYPFCRNSRLAKLSPGLNKRITLSKNKLILVGISLTELLHKQLLKDCAWAPFPLWEDMPAFSNLISDRIRQKMVPQDRRIDIHSHKRFACKFEQKNLKSNVSCRITIPLSFNYFNLKTSKEGKQF